MERKMKQLFSALIPFWKEPKNRNKILIAVGLTGMLLILLSELTQPEAEKTREKSPDQPVTNEVYMTQLEGKLCRLVESISGAGKCQVMVTLEQGTQYVFASESKKVLDETQSRDGELSTKIQQKDNSESKIVVIEENGTSRPLVETSREPTIKGVVVVCEGGNSSIVKERITEALTTVLGIRTNQVCVAPKE